VRRALPLLVWAAATAHAHPPVGIDPPAPPSTPRAEPSTPVTSWLDDVRAQLQAEKLDGWLLYDFRGQNPYALDVVRPRAPLGRWFYLVPATGEPQLLAQTDDRAAFDVARPLTYRDARQLEAQLKLLLRGRRRVAMEYSPRGAVPQLGRVDAGTLELVRAAGAQVLPSGNLYTALRARWTEAQWRAHAAAARALVAVKDDTFTFIAQRVEAHERVTDWDVQEVARRHLAERGLDAADAPVVAVGAHTADPRFIATAESATVIGHGDLVLLSLSARVRTPAAVYADQTWVGFVGDRVPDEAAHLFAVARDARARAVELVEERRKRGQPLRGYEVDDAARAVAARAGMGEHYRLPTGHSLGARRFGDGPNFDDGAARDDRLVLSRTGYVVEPGLYVGGVFGVRTAVDILVAADGVRVTPDPPQSEIERIIK
jgi:Xaa-Pro aminopeptidase